MEQVNYKGENGFYDEKTGFVPLSSLEKVNYKGENGFYNEKVGFISATGTIPSPEWAGKSPNLYGAYGAAKETIFPIAEGLSLAAGDIAKVVNPAAGVALGGGAYAAVKGAKRGIEQLAGERPPSTIKEELVQQVHNVARGTALGMSGGIIGKTLSDTIGKFISPLSKETSKVAGTTKREIPIERKELQNIFKQEGYPATPADLVPESKTLAIIEGILGYTPVSGDVMLKRQIAKMDKLNSIRENLIGKKAPQETIERVGMQIKKEAQNILEKYGAVKGKQLNAMADAFLKRYGSQAPYTAGETLAKIVTTERTGLVGDVTENYNILKSMLPDKGKDIIPVSKNTFKMADDIIEQEMSSAKPNMDIVKMLLNLKARGGDILTKISPAMRRNPEVMKALREMEGLKGQPLTWEGAKLTNSRIGEKIDDVLTSTGGKGTTETTYLGSIKKAIEKDMESYAQNSNPEVWAQYLKSKESSKTMHELFPEDLLKIINKPPEDLLNKIVNKGEVTLLKQIKNATGEEGMIPLRQGFFKKLFESATKNDVLEPQLLSKKMRDLGDATLKELATPQQIKVLNEIVSKGQKIVKRYGDSKPLEFLETLAGDSNSNIVNAIVKPNNVYNIKLAQRTLSPERLKGIKAEVLESKIFKTSGTGTYLPVSSAKEFIKYKDTLKQLLTPEEYSGVLDFIKLGQHATRIEGLAKNASQTGQVLHGMGMLRDALAGRIASLTKITLIPWLLSKVYTSPMAMKYMTSALKLPETSPQAISLFIKAVGSTVLAEQQPLTSLMDTTKQQQELPSLDTFWSE